MPINHRAQKIAQGILNFKYFNNNLFSESFEKFIGGEFIDKTCNFLQKYDKTVRISAKDHFKSTSLYSRFAWDLLIHADTKFTREYHYFSYQEGLAQYHIGKIKDMINRNLYFDGLIDHKQQAEGIIKYSWDGDNFFTLEPHGMLAFKRGLHCNGGVFVDDPFQDPASKLDIRIVEKINYVMKTQVIDIPSLDAFLHIAGTPQTTNDFFFDKAFLKRFQVRVLPAIKDSKKKIVLWPEWMDWDELQLRRAERGDKIFNQEYLCSPTYSELSFFTEAQILEMMHDLPNLPFSRERKTDKDIIAGYDVAKHRHPAHLSVFEVEGEDEKSDWTQIHHHFFDKVGYIKQLEYIRIAIKNLGIDKLYYDATRGELETLDEQGLLPIEMIPVNFTLKKKSAMATEFDKKRTAKKIKLIADERQKRNILCVLNDLKAIETPDGHGDVFWSIALALSYLTEPRVGIY